MNDCPRRKQNRLANYDYSAPGAYFVTICTHEKQCILSRIAVGEGLAPPVVALTAIGSIVRAQLSELSNRYPTLTLDHSVIMPNHVHLLITLHQTEAGTGGASPSPTIMDAVRVLKSLSTRLSRPYLSDSPLWQRSFYEHVIRNERDYLEIWNYIDGNPGRWVEDRFYPGKPTPQGRGLPLPAGSAASRCAFGRIRTWRDFAETILYRGLCRREGQAPPLQSKISPFAKTAAGAIHAPAAVSYQLSTND